MKLWLDDVRPAPPGYAWAKRACDAIDHIKSGKVTHISLDYDLHYSSLENPGDGYEVACYILKGAEEGTLHPMWWNVHSRNPVGQKLLRNVMLEANRVWQMPLVQDREEKMKEANTLLYKGAIYRLSQNSGDIQITNVEFAAGQEPEDDGDVTLVTVDFTMSGKSLARLLGKQQRVLDRALKKLNPQSALFKVLSAPIPDEVKKAAKRLIKEHFVYELAMDPPRSIDMDWAETQPDFGGAKVGRDDVAFTVELDALW